MGTRMPWERQQLHGRQALRSEGRLLAPAPRPLVRAFPRGGREERLHFPAGTGTVTAPGPGPAGAALPGGRLAWEQLPPSLPTTCQEALGGAES